MPNHEMVGRTGKLSFLEGGRALMALNVLLCHFVIVYYPQMYYLDYAREKGGFLSLFATTGLSALVNGNIAVQFFLLLTGFLVGKTFFTKPVDAHEIPSRAWKRYVRLFPVVCASTLVAFGTMVLGLKPHLNAADLVGNHSILLDYNNFEPSLFSLAVNIFVDPYCKNGSSYVGPFWVICYEFWGYVLAMILCVIFRNRKHRHLEYPLAAFLCLNNLNMYYVAVVLGVFLADLSYNPAPGCMDGFFHGWLRRKPVIYGLLAIGTVLACCPQYYTSIYAVLEPIPYMELVAVRAVGLACVMFSVLQMPRVQRVLSHPLLLWLGEYSFEIYGIHWPVMLTFETWLFSGLLSVMGYDMAAILALIVTLPVILACAVVMRLAIRWVTPYGNRLVHFAARTLRGRFCN